MMRNRRKLVSLFILGAAVILAASGCGQATDPNAKVRPNANPHTNGVPQMKYKAVPHDHADRLTGAETAYGRVNQEQLTQLVRHMNGVEQAHVVVNDKDVVVGINAGDDVNKASKLEKQVFSSLHWQYPEYNFYVTADGELFNQIKSLEVSRSNGYRAQAVNNDISAIIQAIARSLTRP